MTRFTQLSVLAAALGMANAAPAFQNLDARDIGLEVTLAPAGNALVEATITNTGAQAINLFKSGSFLSDSPVQKLAVSSKAGSLDFQGIRVSVQRTGLSEDAFTPLAVGSSITKTINAAEVYDLSAGGVFDFAAAGSIMYAAANSTELEGTLYISSPEISMDVDGAAAGSVLERSILNKRTDISSDCTGTKLSATKAALTDCVSLSDAAATAAKSGDADKFEEYFGTTATATRSTVAARFAAVADECDSYTSGATDLYCEDVYSDCSSNVLAYTIPARNKVVYCDLYFDDLSTLAKTCHTQDQATTSIHEFTHAPGVYSPGTDDNAYGYRASSRLTSAEQVLNADSYALYANAIYVGC